MRGVSCRFRSAYLTHFALVELRYVDLYVVITNITVNARAYFICQKRKNNFVEDDIFSQNR